MAFLGDEIDDVAADLGMTGEELAGEFRHDPTLRVDGHGRLLYVDRAISEREAAALAADGASSSVAPYPLDQTFRLHSRSGSNRKIYLDFNGHVTRDTFWNSLDGVSRPSITSAAFNADRQSGFSDSEKGIVQEVFQRVAEDYAPFNVDVTTEDPGFEALRRSSSSDAAFGVRVVISNTDWHNCPCGGEAYTGYFDFIRTDRGDLPAFVYTDTTSKQKPKFIGEASAHEAGHTLGLRHDGTTTGDAYYSGHGVWAPIMGVSYDLPVTQWSKGEYPNANNQEDDLTIISRGGAPRLADDYVGTASTTVTLPAGTTRQGKIEGTGDIDAFKFTLATTRTLQIKLISGIGAGPDLNSRVVIKTAGGTTKVTASPTDNLGASFVTTLPQGSYVTYVSGVGEGTVSTGYSAYASLGNYRLTLTFQ